MQADGCFLSRQAGAAIMDITYGIEVLAKNDPYIELAVAAMNGLDTAGIPGAFLVDALPLLKFVPAWAPGAGFQRKAKEWKRLFAELISVPFIESQKNMVMKIFIILGANGALTMYETRPMALRKLLLFRDRCRRLILTMAIQNWKRKSSATRQAWCMQVLPLLKNICSSQLTKFCQGGADTVCDNLRTLGVADH